MSFSSSGRTLYIVRFRSQGLISFNFQRKTKQNNILSSYSKVISKTLLIKRRSHSKSLWAGCVSYRLQPESQAFVFRKISKKPLKTIPYLNSIRTSRRSFCLSRRRIIRLSTAPSTAYCKSITNEWNEFKNSPNSLVIVRISLGTRE